GGFGNIASGLLTDLISWRATLLINLPIGVGVVIAALVLHRRTTDQGGAGRIDFIGAGLATAAFTCAIYALSVAGAGASGGLLAGVGSVAVASCGVRFRQQRRASHELVSTAPAAD